MCKGMRGRCLIGMIETQDWIVALLTFRTIMDDRMRADSGILECYKMMFHETLLSYRLLFGQDSRSRKLFNHQEHGPSGVDQPPDPLLIRLCGGTESLSKILDDDSIRDQDVYDMALVFPFYSSRLKRLDEYVESIRVRSIGDLWSDQRHPMEWVLIWVVVMIGTVMIPMSISGLALQW